MDKDSPYYRQVQLLVQVLPLVAQEPCFALKGGTAINLFVRDLPRLSVDIDLVYLPIKTRDDSLGDIQQALDRLSKAIQESLVGSEVHKSYEDKPDALRLLVKRAGVQIKVELSPVMRGTVYDSESREVNESVEAEFGYVDMPVVSLADLYGGKVCAALDRQHPRDLFDVKQLLENEGLTEEIRKAALVYLISHNRPIAELLAPTLKDIKDIYESEFARMAEEEVSLDELVAARRELIEQFTGGLSEHEKAFLLSFERRSPDWTLLGLEGVAELPAVKWKQLNLKRMSVDKHAEELRRLESVIESL